MSEIKTHPATPEYRSGWDRIFGKSPDHGQDAVSHQNNENNELVSGKTSEYVPENRDAA